METGGGQALRCSSVGAEQGINTWVEGTLVSVDHAVLGVGDCVGVPEDSRPDSVFKKHQHKHNLRHRYELLETLGRGTYGKVKRALEKHTGREVSHSCFVIRFISIIKNQLSG